MTAAFRVRASETCRKERPTARLACCRSTASLCSVITWRALLANFAVACGKCYISTGCCCAEGKGFLSDRRVRLERVDDRPCARSLPPNRSPHREQCPVRGWTLLEMETPEHVCQSNSGPSSALDTGRRCSDTKSGTAKQHAELMPQRFDARLMIWQQRNESVVDSQPGTLVHETRLLQGQAPLSTGGRHAGSEHWASSGPRCCSAGGAHASLVY